LFQTVRTRLDLVVVEPGFNQALRETRNCNPLLSVITINASEHSKMPHTVILAEAARREGGQNKN
jgi:hypothetical protein